MDKSKRSGCSKANWWWREINGEQIYEGKKYKIPHSMKRFVVSEGQNDVRFFF